MNASVLDDPHYLPFKLDVVARRVLWLRLGAQQRRDAAFLDDRAMPANADGAWSPLDALLTHRGAAAPSAHAIFHIGHCGSTLLSRLLDTWPDVQGLREPLPLRALADAWPALDSPTSRLSPAQAADTLHALWSRWSQALPPAQRSVVKATSSCNGLAEPLLSRQPQMHAVLLEMPLRPWLATLLKSPASVLDAANAAGERLSYLHERGIAGDVALHMLSLPQQCAMGWLAEQLRYEALSTGEHASRVLRMDFETLLDDPHRELLRVVAHLGLDAKRVDEAVVSPAWGRYSKAQTHGYGRDDRAHDLALSMRKHAPEIAQGEAWVDRVRSAAIGC